MSSPSRRRGVSHLLCEEWGRERGWLQETPKPAPAELQTFGLLLPCILSPFCSQERNSRSHQGSWPVWAAFSGSLVPPESLRPRGCEGGWPQATLPTVCPGNRRARLGHTEGLPAPGHTDSAACPRRLYKSDFDNGFLGLGVE